MAIFTPKIIAVSLNPSIDRGIEVANFTVGSHQQGKRLFRRPAGKAVNLARTLGALKIPTMLIGFIGAEQQEYFENYATSDHVSCQLFAVEGKTRENITILDPKSRIETHIRDQGFEVKLADINKLSKKLALLAKPDTIIAFSGSLPPGLDDERFLELIQICKIQEAKVCVDCSGEILTACKPMGLWLIKPNRQELGEMLETTIDTDQQIIEAGNQSTKYTDKTLISLGERGAYLFSKDSTLKGHIELDQSQIENTVGAGDAMLAGFLAAVTENKNEEECFISALATASASILTCVPGDVDTKTITKLAAKAKIEKLK